MKVFLLLLFVFTFPIVIFLAALRFGGFSTETIKTELVKAATYEKMTSFVQGLETDAQDPTTDAITTIIKKRITPSYLQTKIENTIDTSTAWITNQSTTPPTISFKEFKDDIVRENPNLLTSLTDMQENLKQQTQSSEMADAQNGKDPQQAAQMNQAIEGMNSLIKSDFTIHLSSYLTSIKQVVAIINIALPMLAVLCVLYLLGIILLASSVATKATWIGITGIMTGVWGFLLVFFMQFTHTIFSQVLGQNTNEWMRIISPLLLALFDQFTKTYVSYQGIVSISLFVLAAGCFIIASMNKSDTISPPQKKSPVTKKK